MWQVLIDKKDYFIFSFYVVLSCSLFSYETNFAFLDAW